MKPLDFENSDLLRSLTELVERSDHGTRLPTIRNLMRDYRVGQATVQEALAELKAKGLISSQVGRGSYVIKDGMESAEQTQQIPTSPMDAGRRSVLILSNSNMNERCLRVQNQIAEYMCDQGGQVMQMTYTNTDHLLFILKTIPTFDAAILQSHYEVIPVRLLAQLQEKTRALSVDGHTVSGVDIDRMGIDWEEAIDLSLEHLIEKGARRFALITLKSMSQPILSARRYFERLKSRCGVLIETRSLELEEIVYPTQKVQGAIHNALDHFALTDGSLSVDALLFLGISDGAGVRDALKAKQIKIPDEVKVVLLGHVDIQSEHLNYFTVAGGSYEDGARTIIEMIEHRLSNREMEPQVRYLQSRIDTRQST